MISEEGSRKNGTIFIPCVPPSPDILPTAPSMVQSYAHTYILFPRHFLHRRIRFHVALEVHINSFDDIASVQFLTQYDGGDWLICNSAQMRPRSTN